MTRMFAEGVNPLRAAGTLLPCKGQSSRLVSLCDCFRREQAPSVRIACFYPIIMTLSNVLISSVFARSATYPLQ